MKRLINEEVRKRFKDPHRLNEDTNYYLTLMDNVAHN